MNAKSRPATLNPGDGSISQTTWRPLRRASVRWTRLLPWFISAGLLAWLVYRVSPQELARATTLVDWPRLALATVVLVLCLYLWDAVCLSWLFARPGRPLPYRYALQARGNSYLLGAFNYELGQGMLAWNIARVQGIPVVSALGSCVLLAYHDIGVLFGLGLLGSLSHADVRLTGVPWVCGAGVGVLAGLPALAHVLPVTWSQRLTTTRWGSSLHAWSWRRSRSLVVLRGLYYAVILAYAAAGLHLCGVPLDYRVVLGVVPLVLLADGLPISISGLGTREAALLYLLAPERPAVVLAFSMFWSTGLVVGRTAIGLAHWGLPACAAWLAGPGGER